METEYEIEWMEQKTTSKGKQKADCTLKAEGVLVENVTIWGDFPGFADLKPGSKVTGTLTPAKDPKYGPTLYAPRTPKTAPGGGFKAKMMDEAMAKKEASIGRFQATKEESIKHMSAQRDAVLIVTTFFKDRWANDPILEGELDKLIKDKVIMYRDWFLSAEFGETVPF